MREKGASNTIIGVMTSRSCTHSCNVETDIRWSCNCSVVCGLCIDSEPFMSMSILPARFIQEPVLILQLQYSFISTLFPQVSLGSNLKIKSDAKFNTLYFSIFLWHQPTSCGLKQVTKKLININAGYVMEFLAWWVLKSKVFTQKQI